MMEQKKTTGSPRQATPDDRAPQTAQGTSCSLDQSLTLAAGYSCCDQIPNKQSRKGRGLTLAHGFSGYGPSRQGRLGQPVVVSDKNRRLGTQDRKAGSQPPGLHYRDGLHHLLKFLQPPKVVHKTTHPTRQRASNPLRKGHPESGRGPQLPQEGHTTLQVSQQQVPQQH